VNGYVRDYAPRDLTKVPVMCQIDHLSHPRRLAEETEHLLRARIVEALHDVVGDERYGRAERCEFLVAREPEREIELNCVPVDIASVSFEPPSRASPIRISLSRSGWVVRPNYCRR
jgi:hypothetical protein